MELRDDSYFDVPILHQFDFIFVVTGVSFSFDNIFLNEVENEFFCTNIFSDWIVPFLASV
jgi:hypothetical protein